jgi:hypothetical protein
MRIVVVIVLLAFPFRIDAQDLSGFEKILVLADPGAGVIQGGTGSFEATLDALTFEPIEFYPADDGGKPAFGTIRPTLPGPTPRIGDDIRLAGPSPTGAGRVLFLRSGSAGRVRLDHSLWFRLAGQSASRRVGLPIVHERDFLTQPTILGPVGFQSLYSGNFFSPDVRPARIVKLRVYNPDGTGGAVSVLRYRPHLLNDFARGVTIDLDRRDGDDPSHPSYGEATFHDCAYATGRTNPCPPVDVVFVVKPLGGIRYWPMITIIDVLTGDLSVVTPN